MSSSPPLVSEIYDALSALRNAGLEDHSLELPSLLEDHADRMVRTLRISRKDPWGPTNIIHFELRLLEEDATSHETTLR